jgi:hypothetical protein
MDVSHLDPLVSDALRHPIGFFTFHSISYIDVGDLVCWLDLWGKNIYSNCIIFPLCASFTIIFTAYFPATSLGLSLVSGRNVAVSK